MEVSLYPEYLVPHGRYYWLRRESISPVVEVVHWELTVQISSKHRSEGMLRLSKFSETYFRGVSLVGKLFGHALR